MLYSNYPYTELRTVYTSPQPVQYMRDQWREGACGTQISGQCTSTRSRSAAPLWRGPLIAASRDPIATATVPELSL